jgi:hypothetical protein
VIISHSHRYIFFAIPKTGTHSIRRALRVHMDAQDLEHVLLFERKLLPYPELAHLKHGHISAQQIRPLVGESMFGAYFKFAFVRNPFDRFVSYCAFMSRHTGHFATAPRDYMKFIATVERPVEHILFRPQSEIIGDANGQLMIDFVGRVEHLQTDYDRICERIGQPSAVLERSNESTHQDYRSYYDDTLIGLVTDLYRRDLDLFGYTFDGYAADALLPVHDGTVGS